MEVQDLLRPRVKCIGIGDSHYPGSPFEINEILYADSDEKFMVYEDWGKYELHPEDFPHLFKKLAWYEDRELKDMPEYVSYVSLTKKEKIYGINPIDTGDSFNKARVYHKAFKWKFFSRFHSEEKWYYTIEDKGDWYEVFHSSLPATLTDYTQYNKPKIK